MKTLKLWLSSTIHLFVTCLFKKSTNLYFISLLFTHSNSWFASVLYSCWDRTRKDQIKVKTFSSIKLLCLQLSCDFTVNLSYNFITIRTWKITFCRFLRQIFSDEFIKIEFEKCFFLKVLRSLKETVNQKPISFVLPVPKLKYKWLAKKPIDLGESFKRFFSYSHVNWNIFRSNDYNFWVFSLDS